MTNEYFVNVRVRLTERRPISLYGEENRSYDGDVTLSNRTLRYHLGFAVPINQLDELAEKDPDLAIRQIRLDIVDTEWCPLDDRARAVFMGIIPALAIEFYYRDSIIPSVLQRNRMVGYSEIEREYRLSRTAELEKILVGGQR